MSDPLTSVLPEVITLLPRALGAVPLQPTFDETLMDHARQRALLAPGSVRLSDGRSLAYAELGDELGVPFIFMHGVPSSRIAAAMLHESARKSGVRLIAPDRPGYGLSDGQAGRRILDWPRDVAQLADILGLGRFGVIGISGAVPYLLACALSIPERVSQVAILSGLGPLHDSTALKGMHRQAASLYKLASRSPRLGRTWMKLLARTARQSPQFVYRQQMSYLPDVDRSLFGYASMRDLRLADLTEAFRNGSAGAEQEAVLHVTDWGFDLADVTAPVFLWQGLLDLQHPPAMGRFLAGALPNVRAVFAPDDGGFSFINSMDDIFARILREPSLARED